MYTQPPTQIFLPTWMNGGEIHPQRFQIVDKFATIRSRLDALKAPVGVEKNQVGSFPAFGYYYFVVLPKNQN